MDNQIEEVKNKLNILDVIGSYVKLTKTGINYRGICPFHAEKTPSFFVNPVRQMWHCFGCGSGHSIFDFVMKIEGVEFGDALRILANKAGVQLKRENVQLRTERQRLYEICDLACRFFEKQVEGGAGKEAENYLLGRGISKESIKKWRLGYSPDTWGGLTDFLIGQGYKREEVMKAGLAIKKEGGNDSYDRFRGRIMFPVFDLNGAVIGFGGRVFKQQNETAKYINTPQTLLYDKGRTLYGLNFAKLPARKQNQCVVTEGYTDVIMAHQAGFENTVASSGTALTARQLDILKRYSENLILAFDMDPAGEGATKRGINLAQEKGFNIKIAQGKERGKDPADIVLENPQKWQEILVGAKGIMDYYFDFAFSNYDKQNPEGKKGIGKIILPAIKRLQNKIEQSHWLQKASQMLNVKEEALLQELSKVKIEGHAPPLPNSIELGSGGKDYLPEIGFQDISENQRKKLVEERVLALVIKNPENINLIEENQYEPFSDKIKNFLKEVKKVAGIPFKNIRGTGEQNDLKKSFTEAVGQLTEEKLAGDPEFQNFLAALAIQESLSPEDIKKDQEELKICLLQLKNISLKDKLNKLSEEIKKAEYEKSHQKVNELIEEFNKLTKEL